MVNGLTLAAAGFTVTAWAVFKEYSWWHTGALLSAIVGLVAEVAVVLFGIGLVQISAAISAVDKAAAGKAAMIARRLW